MKKITKKCIILYLTENQPVGFYTENRQVGFYKEHLLNSQNKKRYIFHYHTGKMYINCSFIYIHTYATP